MHFSASTLMSVAFACGVVGACQSVIWIALTVCAILTFRCVLRTPQYRTDHVIVTTIVKLYFEGDECKVESYPGGYNGFAEVSHAKPIVVFSWMIAFLVISSMQLISSMLLLKRRRGESLRHVLKEWCLITFLASVMDAVLSGIFIRDYIALKEYLEMYCNKDEKGIAMAAATMLIIAARGFALWIVNVVFLLYFGIFLMCTTHEPKLGGSEGKRETAAAIGLDNRAFKSSSEALVRWPAEGECFSPYDATPEMIFKPVTQQHRRFSVSPFEAVTRFNEEEYARVGSGKKRESKTDRSRFECNCHKSMDTESGAVASRWQSNLYHSHGCPVLRAELEEKLATMRNSAPHNAKKLTDFSHNLRNFKPGKGGSVKAKAARQSGWIPKAPPVPVAATCNDSGFY